MLKVSVTPPNLPLARAPLSTVPTPFVLRFGWGGSPESEHKRRRRDAAGDVPEFGLWLTLAVFVRLAPRAFLSLPAGSLVDRSNLRSVAALSPLIALIGVMYFVRGAEMVLHVYVVRDQLGADVERIGLLSGAVGPGRCWRCRSRHGRPTR